MSSPCHASHITKSRGFTLLEAMVALVIFSMVAIGIYSWINTNLITLNRLAEVAATEQVLNSSIERLKLVDMSTETSGRFNVNGYWVDWNAELIEPWRQGVVGSAVIGAYDVSLVNIKLVITKDGHVSANFNYRRTAYKQVRQLKQGDDQF